MTQSSFWLRINYFWVGLSVGLIILQQSLLNVFWLVLSVAACFCGEMAAKEDV